MAATKAEYNRRLREFRDAWVRETEEPMTLSIAAILFDEYNEAQYQIRAGGGYDPVEEDQQPVATSKEYDPDTAYERWLEDQGAE